MPKGKSESLNKAHLDAWGQRVQSSMTDLARHMTATFGKEREHTDKQFTDVKQSISGLDQQFVEVNIKLDAIMDMLATRKELQNLVRALKHQGIRLDESEIFVA